MIFRIKSGKKSNVYSAYLDRKVGFEIFQTKSVSGNKPCGLLLLNDGQLSDSLKVEQTLSALYKIGCINAVQVVAIHAGDRMAEYGVSGMSDYLGRGKQARQYENFIIHELLPLLNKTRSVPFLAHQTAFAGFSLGGLSAIDIVTSNPSIFSTAGVFSGSLWWRRKSYEEGYTDHDRIIFQKIIHSRLAENFRCYLMAGTNDESNDRNSNGIIDAVDDTLDLYELLYTKIKKPEADLFLNIVEGGRHDVTTWSKLFPEFLVHAFGSGDMKVAPSKLPGTSFV